MAQPIKDYGRVRGLSSSRGSDPHKAPVEGVEEEESDGEPYPTALVDPLGHLLRRHRGEGRLVRQFRHLALFSGHGDLDAETVFVEAIRRRHGRGQRVAGIKTARASAVAHVQRIHRVHRQLVCATLKVGLQKIFPFNVYFNTKL
jgi:hypothetical protein